MFVLMVSVTSYAQYPKTNSSLPNSQSPYDFVYVRGKVQAPTKILFTDSLTLFSVIEQAGGASTNVKRVIVNLYRVIPSINNHKRSIHRFKLKDIRAGRAPNMNLQAGDVIDLQPQNIKRPKVGICGL
jgi:protein involved in polysaccharide export with SLBB domain